MTLLQQIDRLNHWVMSSRDQDGRTHRYFRVEYGSEYWTEENPSYRFFIKDNQIGLSATLPDNFKEDFTELICQERATVIVEKVDALNKELKKMENGCK